MAGKQNGSRLGAGWMLRSLWGLILGARQAKLSPSVSERLLQTAETAGRPAASVWAVAPECRVFTK